MKDNGYVVLDTKAIDEFINKKDRIISAYNEINADYDRIVSELLANWKGKGAEAFEKDAKAVKANIVGIFDILRIMCDTLVDCRQVFGDCDSALGDYNRNPDSK